MRELMGWLAQWLAYQPPGQDVPVKREMAMRALEEWARTSISHPVSDPDFDPSVHGLAPQPAAPEGASPQGATTGET